MVFEIFNLFLNFNTIIYYLYILYFEIFVNNFINKRKIMFLISFTKIIFILKFLDKFVIKIYLFK